MSGKVKMIRQAPPDEMNIEDHEMAIKIRQKSSYTNELEQLKSWVVNQPSTIIEDKVLGKVIAPSMKMLPANPKPIELQSFFDYILEEFRIPPSEVRAFQISCIKPMELYESSVRKNTKEITIKQCIANTSDRFVFFGGSKELLRYSIINIDQLRKAAKLPPNAHIPRQFVEQVSQNSMIHMDLVAGISNTLVLDNQTSYLRPKREKFRENYKISKNPGKRWVVVLDVIATSEKFETVLQEKLSMIGHIVGSKPESQEAKVLQTFTPSKDASKDPATQTEQSKKEDDEECPLLVDVPECDQKEPSRKSDEDDSDVEDIEIPSEVGEVGEEKGVLVAEEKYADDSVSQDVLDAL